MNLLALDTSTPACSVALQAGTRYLERHEVRPREHTRLLLPMVTGLLHEAGIEAAGLDAVVLGNGPGSFMGMRIAASVAQGLCYATGAAMVPVSSLAAVAAEVLRTDAKACVAVAQDAHLTEVYLALFSAGAGGLPEERLPVRLQPVAAIGELPPGCVAAGAGWARYPELYEANRERLAGRAAIDYPRARELLGLGAAALRRGDNVPPELLEPAYVRERVAMPPAG